MVRKVFRLRTYLNDGYIEIIKRPKGWSYLVVYKEDKSNNPQNYLFPSPMEAYRYGKKVYRHRMEYEKEHTKCLNQKLGKNY